MGPRRRKSRSTLSLRPKGEDGWERPGGLGFTHSRSV